MKTFIEQFMDNFSEFNSEQVISLHHVEFMSHPHNVHRDPRFSELHGVSTAFIDDTYYIVDVAQGLTTATNDDGESVCFIVFRCLDSDTGYERYVKVSGTEYNPMFGFMPQHNNVTVREVYPHLKTITVYEDN